MTYYRVSSSNFPCEPGEPDFTLQYVNLRKWQLRQALRNLRSQGFSDRVSYLVESYQGVEDGQHDLPAGAVDGRFFAPDRSTILAARRATAGS